MLTTNSRLEWFISWFDTRYYQMLYRDRDHHEAERFLQRLLLTLAPAAGSKMLDLACGVGRHSIFLNKQGFHVTGVDASVNSIAKAAAFSNESLHFAVHDMREPYADQSYDFVFNLFTSFGYFEDPSDDLRVLQAVYKALKPRGRFVFDFFNAEKVRTTLVSSETKVVDDIVFSIEREISGGFVIKTIRFVDAGKSFVFQEKVRLLSAEDIQSYFAQAGFKVANAYGNYAMQPFAAESSDRLIFIAEKV